MQLETIILSEKNQSPKGKGHSSLLFVRNNVSCTKNEMYLSEADLSRFDYLQRLSIQRGAVFFLTYFLLKSLLNG